MISSRIPDPTIKAKRRKEALQGKKENRNKRKKIKESKKILMLDIPIRGVQVSVMKIMVGLGTSLDRGKKNSYKNSYKDIITVCDRKNASP
jgi:hypothetical protein